MKRLLCVILILLLLIACLSCSTNPPLIEECEWKMRTVMSDSDYRTSAYDFVVAVGETDAIYPDAKVIELTLNAENGELTLTDATNSKTYSGTYKVSSKSSKNVWYEITIDGIKGYVSIAQTEYYDGSEAMTLSITLGDYALYFVPND